jgi:hypothetical protein
MVGSTYADLLAPEAMAKKYFAPRERRVSDVGGHYSAEV